jgi:hypothetical protein
MKLKEGTSFVTKGTRRKRLIIVRRPVVGPDWCNGAKALHMIG